MHHALQARSSGLFFLSYLKVNQGISARSFSLYFEGAKGQKAFHGCSLAVRVITVAALIVPVRGLEG